MKPQSLQTRVTRRVVLFTTILFLSCLPVTGGVFLHSLREMRERETAATLVAARLLVESELRRLADDATRLAGSLPLHVLGQTDGPFHFVAPFTRELNRFDFDGGWLLRASQPRPAAWIDGRRRIVTTEVQDELLLAVCEDLERRPWPAEGDEGGRASHFSNAAGYHFVRTLPLYDEGRHIAWLVVTRQLQPGSPLAHRIEQKLEGIGLGQTSLSLVNAATTLVTFGNAAGAFIEERDQVIGDGPLRVRIVSSRIPFLTTAGIALLGLVLVFLGATLVLLRGVGKVIGNAVAPEMAERAKREEELRRRGLEAEIAALRSQMQPHFLFNSLNMIAQTIPVEPTQALEMTHALAELYRAVHESATRSSHPLTEELRVVELYLRTQRLRFGQRLRFTLPCPAPELGQVAIPCLLLQTLVENAIKHGLAPEREGGEVTVSAQQFGATMAIEVRNTGASLREPVTEGTGLRNSRRRWQLLHGENATLDLGREPDGSTLVRLECPA